MPAEESPSGPSEVLTQADIERLLAQVTEQESRTVVLTPGGGLERRPRDDVHPCDFRQPAFLSAGELRKLRLRHEEFIRALAARLSVHLRMEFVLLMSKLQTVTYQRLLEAFPNPTHLVMFKTDPLRGISILNIPPRFGLTVVDRLLGGPAHSVDAGRDLSEIEIALLNQIVHIILSEWCTHWAQLADLRPVILGQESNPRFLQTSPLDTIMLELAMEARLGDCTEQIQMVFPYYALEPLVAKLNASLDPNGKESAQPTAPAVKWNPSLEGVHVPVTAEWDELTMRARQVAELRVGEIIPLDPHQVQRVRVRLAGMSKFVGRLGTRGGSWAVEIEQVLRG